MFVLHLRNEYKAEVTNDTPISLSLTHTHPFAKQNNFSTLDGGLLHTPGTTQCVVVVCRTPFDGTAAVLEPFHPIPTNKNDLEERGESRSSLLVII